jgi:hypothetical protein
MAGPRLIDGAGGPFSKFAVRRSSSSTAPGCAGGACRVTCLSTKRWAPSPRSSPALIARCKSSWAMSPETSRDHPSAALNATTRTAFSPADQKILDGGLKIGLGGVGLVIGDAVLAVVNQD